MAQSIQDPRLAFVVDYDDPQAGITRKYQLMYFLTDKTIEMFDIKNRRIFLKRCPYASLEVNDLYLGATITIFSRQLQVSEYGDEHTRKVFSKKSEATLGIIKPDGYEKMGEIFRCLSKEGIRVKNIHMVQMTQEEAAHFFERHQGQPYYRDLIQHMIAYPVIALHLVGEDCITRWNKILGPADPVQAKQAAPVSLRAKYGTSTVCNICHGSEDPQVADSEILFFFGENASVKRRNNAALSNCTLGIIKPHAIAQGIAGDIIQAILEDGFEISAIALACMNTYDAEDFLEVYKGVVPEYPGIVEQLTSGACWVMEIRAENAVQSFRQLCGPHDPEIARVLRPDSLRAKFGADKVKNAIHCTDLPEDGVLEVEFFFRIMASKLVETK
jgi:nucleoside-diphosphate kinase|uniref:DM10 domain-containing protein n=1 Tax=Eutreptiella gymnastica TaxID=73025 RepID=A0A7S4LP05_9EUGL